jgi:hypothetical protein
VTNHSSENEDALRNFCEFLIWTCQRIERLEARQGEEHPNSLSLLGIVVAWLSGARFVGTTANGASLTMAVATGVSILCYVVVLFIVPGSSTEKGTP